MRSYLKPIFGFAAGAVCLMCAGQIVVAQSGDRSGAFQQPAAALQQFPTQQFPAAAATGSFGPRQGFDQRANGFSSGTQSLGIQNRETQFRETVETRPRQVARVGFGQYDHRGWDALLQKYVDRDGNVDYATWQTSGQDRSVLVDYLRGMNSIDTTGTSNRQGEMAFWINAYNALTIEGILQLYPTKSIKDHAPDANGFNIWDDFKVSVGGTEYSLNDIEHNILRKMGDPRIHFAIVCASKSCPQLHGRAYFPEHLEQQLTYASQLFFHTPGKFSYDVQRSQIGLSPIVDWFGEDFGRGEQERLQYLSQFMPADAAGLATSGYASISYLDYDWGLNVAPVQSSARGQELLQVQALRPQGSSTRQVSQGEYVTPEGSGTRQQFEANRPSGCSGQGGRCGRGNWGGRGGDESQVNYERQALGR